MDLRGGACPAEKWYSIRATAGTRQRLPSTVRAVVIIAAISIVAVACQSPGGSPSATRSSVTAKPLLTVEEIGFLDDDTLVVVEGLVVKEEDHLLLASGILDIFPPMYNAAVALSGVDPDAFDFFRYPVSELRWSDYYRVTGHVSQGVLEVTDMQRTRPNESRAKHNTCRRAAVDHPNDHGGCPTGWFPLYLNPAG